MLYVTTRNSKETYTAYKALTQDFAPNGGFFVPLKFPTYTWGELTALGKLGFYACVCHVLNPFCNGNLIPSDLEFKLGRKPVRVYPLNKKTLFVQLWHNPQENFDYFCKGISDLILEDRATPVPSNWTKILCRISILFATITPLIQGRILQESDAVDVSVVGDDFTAAMAVWYARTMGLPVGQIVSSSPEDTIWSLLHYGEHRSEAQLPRGLERLIHGCGGTGEVKRFLEQYNYVPNELLLEKLRFKLQIGVISKARTVETITHVYRSHGYLMGLSSAMAYAGLLDCRSSCSTGKLGLVMEDNGCDPKVISTIFDISMKEAQERIDAM